MRRVRGAAPATGRAAGGDEPVTHRSGGRWRWRWRRLPRPVRAAVRVLAYAGLVGVVLAAIPYGWTRVDAAGHLHDEADAPTADVILVLGAQVAPGGTAPMPFLRGRLDTAAGLLERGRATVILVSGDGTGGSGNETGVMTSYLVDRRGVDRSRVVADPYGLDTYDSCVRARRVYGVTRALVVTQPYHLARAVALCRHVGVDAEGVGARCDGCVSLNLARNAVRDYFACTKAALDALRDRPPAVQSPPDRAVTAALAAAS
jgi:vancomycin permeability regulator SanA